jgi:hypothetical protein
MKTGTTRFWITGMVCLLPWVARGEVGADLWTWADVTYYEKGAFRAHLFAHQAAADGRGPIVQLVSPRVHYRVAPWLEVGAGFSMLRIENADSGEFSDQQRPELEVNPGWNLGEDWKLAVRNRFEMRWDEQGGEPRPRGRHRLQLTRTLKDMGPLTAVYVSNEWLFEYDRGDWTENRVVPAGLTLRLNARASVDLFYMFRSFRFDEGWTNDHIAGVYLKLKL